MSVTYRVTKKVFRAVLPRRARAMIWSDRNPLSRSLRRVKARLERGAPHDELYDRTYYAQNERDKIRSFGVIADAIIAEFSPRTLLDVGCGAGVLLGELTTRGGVGKGLEHSSAAMAMCRKRGVDVDHFDLESDQPFSWAADVAVSTEVAEHLPEAMADRFVRLLCSCGRAVVMTAATPGQGGTDHVNEQPNEYWIEKFAARGFRFDRDLTDRWRRDWHAARVNRHYADNVMVFRRES